MDQRLASQLVGVVNFPIGCAVSYELYSVYWVVWRRAKTLQTIINSTITITITITISIITIIITFTIATTIVTTVLLLL